LLGALIFLWPFLRWLRIKGPRDLGLERNRHWLRDLILGFVISALPVICCEIVLVQLGTYAMRDTWSWEAVGQVTLTAAVVPLIEESLFRGLFLGVLLRGLRRWPAIAVSAAIFSIIHFLKAPDQTTLSVQWSSGFVSLTHAFDQFGEPMLVLAGFTTLFVIGLILADARIWTQSLWLPIGLHAGWILASSVFAKVARREVFALPWLGKSMLIGLVPLAVCLISWALLRVWLSYAPPRED
ncbi:MAG TPA: CPBP family intramembrane glutamic endopeptidase, partial [Chthoniobacterales bacterium]